MVTLRIFAIFVVMEFLSKNIIIAIVVFATFFISDESVANICFQFSSTSLTGTDFVTSSLNSIRVESDSISSNIITKVWYTSAEINVEVYQVIKQQEITITVYNMLGKEVLEVFRGTTSSNEEEVFSKTFNLPNGIYICVMQGKSFKDSEKFIISR